MPSVDGVIRKTNGGAIDAAGELPGGKHFSSPKELKAIIAERSDDFSRNLVQRLLAYALCRRLEGYDEIVVDDLMQDIAADGYRMQTLIGAVVTSYPFTHRRIPEQRDVPMMKSVLIDRRTCLQGMGASLALPLLETMGWAETTEGKTYKPPVRLGFMYMPHGVIMDQFWPADAAEFPVIATASLGIAAARARPVPPDEGNLGSSHLSVQRRTSRSGTLHLADGDFAELQTSGMRSTSRFPRTRLPRITWEPSRRCRRWNWPRCHKRGRKTRKG